VQFPNVDKKNKNENNRGNARRISTQCEMRCHGVVLPPPPRPEGFPIIKSILSQFHQFQYDITPCIGNYITVSVASAEGSFSTL